MTQQIVYPTQRELERHAECMPCPYQRGFEDGRYPGLSGSVTYRNPYGIDYDKWLEYDAGFTDARKAARQERV